MIFFKKIFGSKKKELNKEDDDINNLTIEIIESIKKCKLEKETAYKNIDDIMKKVKELIWGIFKVPNKYWYEELNKYEKIKKTPENLEISEIVIKKCDEIIFAYREQIELKKSKIKFSETLFEKYKKIQNNLNQIKRKDKKNKKEQKQLKLLEKHSKLISEMNENDNRIEKIYESSEELNFFENDIKAIEEEFKFKQKLHSRFDEIGLYGSNNEQYENSKELNNEIKKLTEEL